ncbi:hypothetical protein SCP_0403830 [Sparassis crispa]|uniref:Uncharacterized protein n=1 Tax=Sparassis crispa TaxID=139825 RepID=A0A401GIK5_9APHY|nr:hypothetical protein SCP_0403830 [Sparassis crispa]GBE82007.1 hypothetical protein SCP_0403830 [Sparassis crispa]
MRFESKSYSTKGSNPGHQRFCETCQPTCPSLFASSCPHHHSYLYAGGPRAREKSIAQLCQNTGSKLHQKCAHVTYCV